MLLFRLSKIKLGLLERKYILYSFVVRFDSRDLLWYCESHDSYICNEHPMSIRNFSRTDFVALHGYSAQYSLHKFL